MVTTSSALAQVDLNLGKAARNLGATGAQAFRTIALPQIRPAVMSGALFAFITSLDEVVISSFISGGENATLTKKMSSGLRHQVDPTSAAMKMPATARNARRMRSQRNAQRSLRAV